MFKGALLQHALNYSLCIIAFAIPFPFIYSSLAIILFFIVWLLQVNVKTLANNLKTRRILWLWILLFLLHLMSYTYSIDKNESIFDLQRKLSFIVLPVIIGAGISVDKNVLERVFLFFVIGVSIVGAFCLTRAYLVYYYTGDTRQFFYHPLIKGSNANAVYEALYTLFSIVTLLFFPWQTKLIKHAKVFLLILQIVFFILLSSRTLIVIFFILILPLYIKRSFSNDQRSLLYSLILLLSYFTLAIAVFKTDNPIKQRYTEIINENEKIVWNDFNNNRQKEFNNLSLRLFLWKVGLDNMKEHNLWLKGAGNGSIYTLQNRKMAEYGVMDIYNKEKRSPLYNVNLHNMYLQIFMMLGIIGIVPFILIVFSPFMYISHFDYKIILFLFAFIMIFLMMQEASLQTQAGIVFYTFFSMVFYNHACESRGQSVQKAKQITSD